MVGDVVAAVDNGGVAVNVADRDGGVAVDRVVGVVGAPYLEMMAVDVVGDVVVFRGVDTGVVAAVDRVVSLVGAPYLEVMAVDMVGDAVATVENGGVADNVAGGDVIVAVDRVVGVIYLVVLAVDMANDSVEFGGVDTVAVAAVDAIAAVDRVLR